MWYRNNDELSACMVVREHNVFGIPRKDYRPTLSGWVEFNLPPASYTVWVISEAEQRLHYLYTKSNTHYYRVESLTI